MKKRKRGLALLLGMVLCISMIFAAVPVYGAESTEPNVNQDGKIVSEIDSRHNDIKKRDELIASLGEDEMEFLIWQEGEYEFGGLRWSIWGGTRDTYT